MFPCLLFGAESWILNSTLLQKLESFQAELAKRILRLPTHTSNNNARMALQWPSMRARILIIKLCFLLKVVNSDHSLSARVFRSLAASDHSSMPFSRVYLQVKLYDYCINIFRNNLQALPQERYFPTRPISIIC